MKSRKKELWNIIALFSAWIIILWNVETAVALQITFNPDANVSVGIRNATIAWTTDQNATGRINYAPEQPLDSNKVDTALRTNHTFTLTGLTANRKYLFEILAGNGTQTVRLPLNPVHFFEFKTLPAPDTTPPGPVVALSVTEVKAREVTLAWDKNPTDTDVVGYTVYKDGEVVASNITEKKYTVTGLAGSTKYTLKVNAIDAAGNQGSVTSVDITTKIDTERLVVITAVVADALGTSAVISWKTNFPAHSRVEYAKAGLLLESKQENPAMVTEHNVTLGALEKNQSYTYRALSCDQYGNCANSSEFTFETVERAELFLEINQFKCGETKPFLHNSNQLDVSGKTIAKADVTADVNGARKRYKRTSTDGIFVFNGIDLDASNPQNSLKILADDRVSKKIECERLIKLDYLAPEVQINNITPFTQQSSVELSGNISDDSDMFVKVYLTSGSDTTGPRKVTNLTNESLLSSAVKLKWDAANDEDFDLYLIYRDDVTVGPVDYTKDKSWNDDQVSPGIVYTYRVSAVDRAGNEGERSEGFRVRIPGPAQVNKTLGSSAQVVAKAQVPATKQNEVRGQNKGAGQASGMQPRTVKKDIPTKALVVEETVPATGVNRSVSFRYSVQPLYEGKNNIRAVFSDEAGNIFEQTFSVLKDSKPPKIISPSSAQLVTLYSPSYVSEIEIVGQVDDSNATVWVFVNPGGPNAAEPQKKVKVGPNGTFSVTINLERKLVTGTAAAGGSQSTVGVGTEGVSTSAPPPPTGGPVPGSPGGQPGAYGGLVTSGSFENLVRIVAVDTAQQKSDPVEGKILLTACGQGNYIFTKLEIPNSIINTREIIQGLASFGLKFDSQWQGPGVCTNCLQKPRVISAPLSEKEKKRYDNDWMQLPATVTTNANNTQGFILLNIKPQDPPGKTMYEKEAWLSDHRPNECAPGNVFGCIHLLLVMEQPFINPSSTPPVPGGIPTIGSPTTFAPGLQKKCIDLRIAIDRRPDPSAIPKGFLTAMITAINGTINFINLIYGPIKTITLITIGLCLLSWVSQFFVAVNAQFQCKLAAVSGASPNIGELIKSIRQRVDLERIAKFGGCDVEFAAPSTASDEEKQAKEALRSACNTCASALNTKKDVSYAFHFVCDRIMCPPVPTLQYYIKQHYRGAPRPTMLADYDCPTGENDYWDQETSCVCKAGGAAPLDKSASAGSPKASGVSPASATPPSAVSGKAVFDTTNVFDTTSNAITGYQGATPGATASDASSAASTAGEAKSAVGSATGNRCTKGQRCRNGKCEDAKQCDALPGGKGRPPCKCGRDICRDWSQSCVGGGDTARCSQSRNTGIPACTQNAPATEKCYCGAGLVTCEAGQKCENPQGAAPSCTGSKKKSCILSIVNAPIEITEDCVCPGFGVCPKGSYCFTGEKKGCSKSSEGTGLAVLSIDPVQNAYSLNEYKDLPNEDSDLKEPEEAPEESPAPRNAITGFAPAPPVPPPAPAIATPPTSSDTGGIKPSGVTDPSLRTITTLPSFYYQFRDYEQNKYDFKTPARMREVKSDCELVEIGREPIGKMFRAYEGLEPTSRFGLAEGEAKTQNLAEKCSKPHVYQAACCPFEYMQEWGLGALFLNEMKFSHCLANPDDQANCGFGTAIVRGITGVCEPQSGALQTFVELDGIEYAPNLPTSDQFKFNGAVVYFIKLDESGSVNIVRRGYNGRAASLSTATTGQTLAEGNIPRDGTVAFIPIDINQNLAFDFPKRDNSNLNNEKDRVQALSQTEWFADLCNAIKSNVIRTRGQGQLTCDPKRMELWWRQIAGLMGDPGRQYIVRPAGSMIQSLISLCLTSILSWLTSFRNMLQLLMQCFQTILITGDGSAGQCQSIISQYICDIIYEAISCFIKRFGGPGGASIGEGGIGGFFGAVNAAGREVNSEARSRYGDTNFFTQQFTTEKLVHDVCVFAFTGEWPTDWGALLESQVTLPIASTAWIFPITRRWQSYDATTGKSGIGVGQGHATYVYRIGYTLNAGADINFQLKLVCTNKNCAEGKDGKCDCAHASAASYTTQGIAPFIGDVYERVIPVHVDDRSGNCPVNGFLKQGKICSEDILVKVSAPVRFDKAVLSWTFVGAGAGGGKSAVPTATTVGSGNYYSKNVADPTALNGFSEGGVRELGGPPLGLCDFNLGRLSFLCGIEIPSTGVARFVGTHQLLRKDAFVPGESKIASFRVEVQQPKDATSCVVDCNYTKYLVLKQVVNERGGRVYPKGNNPPLAYERLTENRLKEFVFFDRNDLVGHSSVFGDFQISPEDFGITTGAAGAGVGVNPCQFQQVGIGVTGAPDCGGVGEIQKAAIEVTDVGTHAGTQNKELAPADKAFSYQTLEQQAGTGIFSPQGEKRDCKVVTALPIPGTLQSQDTQIECGGMKFFVAKTYLEDKARRKAANKIRILLDRMAVAGGGKATSVQCTDRPEKWKAFFEIRDARDEGGIFTVSTMPSVDPQGGKTTMEIEFPVVCKGGLPKGATARSIIDLAPGSGITAAKVTSENTQQNPSFGMWSEPGALAPGEEIIVSNFEWINSLKKEEGFQINIESAATIAPLYIDLRALGIEATDQFQVVKNQKTLPSYVLCSAPCVLKTPTDGIVVLNLRRGDPQFKFTGFRSTLAVDDFTKYTLASAKTFTLTKDKPADKKVTGKFLDKGLTSVEIGSYVPVPGGFDIKYSAAPPIFLDPLTLAFNVKDTLGLDASTATITTDGKVIPKCQGNIFAVPKASAAGKALTNLSTGSATANRCYASSATDVGMITLGSPGETIEVRGLKAGVEPYEKKKGIADIKESCITLTAAQAFSNEIIASDASVPGRLSQGRTIKLCNYRPEKDGFLVDVSYDYYPAPGGDPDPTISLDMRLLTSDWDSMAANVDVAGLGALPDCLIANVDMSDLSQTAVRPPQCIISRDKQGVIFMLLPFSTATFRFRGLKTSKSICNAAPDGTKCEGEHTECIGGECQSLCYKDYSASAAGTGATKFCINVANENCMQAGKPMPKNKLEKAKCPGGKDILCCPTGVAKNKPKALPAGHAKPAVAPSVSPTASIAGKNYFMKDGKWMTDCGCDKFQYPEGSKLYAAPTTNSCPCAVTDPAILQKLNCIGKECGGGAVASAACTALEPCCVWDGPGPAGKGCILTSSAPPLPTPTVSTCYPPCIPPSACITWETRSLCPLPFELFLKGGAGGTSGLCNPCGGFEKKCPTGLLCVFGKCRKNINDCETGGKGASGDACSVTSDCQKFLTCIGNQCTLAL